MMTTTSQPDQAGLQELNLDPKKFVPRAILSAISASKSRMLSPQDCAQGSRSYFDEVVGPGI